MKPVNRTNLFISLGLLVLTWLAAMVLTGPLHSFPLNDDWSYSLMVKNLVEQGEFIPQNWLASPILTQVLWGALFCLPKGFSFEALTLSTLALSIVSVIFTFLLMMKITGKSSISLIISLLLLANPLFLNLSVTFMMDIHFYSFLVMSVYFYLRYLETNKQVHFWLGAAMGLLSFFIRQYGLIIPVAFIFTGIIQQRAVFTRRMALHMIVLLVYFLLYSIFNRWLALTERMPENYRSLGQLLETSLPDLVWRVYTRTGLLLNHAGLLLLPLLIILFLNDLASIRKNIKVLAIILLVLLFPVLRTIPGIPSGNILYDLGLGPVTTRDLFIEGQGLDMFSVGWVWYIFRPLSFIGAVLLILTGSNAVIRITAALRPGSAPGSGDVSHLIRAAGLLLLILYTVITMINFTFFDRYVIPFLLLVVLTIHPFRETVPGAVNRLAAVSVPYITIFLLSGILATGYYLGWNKARWDGARKLIDAGVPAHKIDGGHEFNGWHGASIDRYGRWETSNYDYAVSFIPLEGHRAIDTIYFGDYGLFPVNRLYISKKGDN